MRAAIPDSEHSSEWVLRADTINKADYRKGNGNRPCPKGFPLNGADFAFRRNLARRADDAFNQRYRSDL